jgi:transcription antitermination factor NusG
MQHVGLLAAGRGYGSGAAAASRPTAALSRLAATTRSHATENTVGDPVRVTTMGVVQDWPEGFRAALPEEHWLVVHAHPRQEKKVIADLKGRRLPGCAFFERRLRHYPGKGTQESLVPLIPGYLFVVGGREERDTIYATRRVVRIIEVPRPQELARDLRHLIALVTAASSSLVVRPELVPGRRVAITTGTFAGCNGIITRRSHDFELVVNLELLGTSVSVTLPADYAELAVDA